MLEAIYGIVAGAGFALFGVVMVYDLIVIIWRGQFRWHNLRGGGITLYSRRTQPGFF
jgi:hypothetical protein